MRIPEALLEVYRRPAYAASALVIAAVAAALLVWSGQVLAIFPEGGVFINAAPATLIGLGLAAILLGVTIPLHWYAGRRSAQTASGHGIGAVGALFSVGSLSCCAPLLLPGILSLLGFTGTSLLAFNLRLHQLRTPLTILALAFLLLSLGMGLKSVTRACRVRPRPPVPETVSGGSAA